MYIHTYAFYVSEYEDVFSSGTCYASCYKQKFLSVNADLYVPYQTTPMLAAVLPGFCGKRRRYNRLLLSMYRSS